jgi:diacylglycerol kinase family enzyme
VYSRDSDRRGLNHPQGAREAPEFEIEGTSLGVPPVTAIHYSSTHLILNPAAGGAGTSPNRLTVAAQERGIRVRILEPGESVHLAAVAAVETGADVLGVAGGDGSVAAVAGVAAESGVPLVIVPTGTLNHFACDLGLDLERPLRALDAFAGGHAERRVDIGRVNGRPFINNVSLGVYAEMLGDPDYRHRKLRVAYARLRDAVLDAEQQRVLRVAAPGEAPLENVVVVIVSNNPYEYSPLSVIGRRYRLDTGTLQTTVLSAATLGEMDRMLAGVLLGSIERHPGLRHWTNDRLEVGGSSGRIRAGIDGEPMTLEAPLRFSVDPGALRVLVPSGTGADRHVPPLRAGWHVARRLRRWLRASSTPSSLRPEHEDLQVGNGG